MIKLRSIMNRDNKHLTGAGPMQRIEELASPKSGDGKNLMDKRSGANSAVRGSGLAGDEFITS